MIGWYHRRFIHTRRIDTLAQHLCELIETGSSVLDVGSGDGRLAASILERRPDLSIHGVDVLVRDDTAIPVQEFDGTTLPRESRSIDTVIMVDVLHHTESPGALLREAARVARRQVILKDHYRRGVGAAPTLALMDHIGNARHGVASPGTYLSPPEWTALYRDSGVRPVRELQRLGLYPWPLSWMFGRGLHFIAVLEPRDR